MSDRFELVIREEENQVETIVVEPNGEKVFFSLRLKRKKWHSLRTILTQSQARVLGDQLLYFGKRK